MAGESIVLVVRLRPHGVGEGERVWLVLHDHPPVVRLTKPVPAPL
jgi:hypothetical protein